MTGCPGRHALVPTHTFYGHKRCLCGFMQDEAVADMQAWLLFLYGFTNGGGI